MTWACSGVWIVVTFWFSVGGWYMFLCLVGSDLCIDLVLGCVALDTVGLCVLVGSGFGY